QVLPVDTNIIIYDVAPGISAADHVERLREAGILCMAIAPQRVRMVMHLDVDDAAVERTITALQQIAA
ncbi:MAG: hypothetical protein KDB87_03840, partial [Flavobacteriales bacterium]|nr:hypothetical protein [Flavobacteriales bacterium]